MEFAGISEAVQLLGLAELIYESKRTQESDHFSDAQFGLATMAN